MRYCNWTGSKCSKWAQHFSGDSALCTEHLELIELRARVAELEAENERLRDGYPDERSSMHVAELSGRLDDHPEGYDGPCWCRTCMSYAAQDGAALEGE